MGVVNIFVLRGSFGKERTRGLFILLVVLIVFSSG